MSDDEDTKVELEENQNIVKYIFDLSKEMNIDGTCGILGNELELIALVRNCCFLYDKNLSDFKDVRKKNVAWSAIASVMHCKVYEVQQRWRSLREAYNKYKKEIELSEEVHDGMVRTWEFYEEMKFIEPHIVHRRSCSSKGSCGSYGTDIEANVSNDGLNINDNDRAADIMRLILCIKDRPVLYDNKHANYKCKALKTEAWNEIAQAMGVSVVECEQKWRNLRERYGRERKVKSIHADRRSWEYFDSLNFLDAHIKPRKHSLLKPSLAKLDNNINNLAIISSLNNHATSKNQNVLIKSVSPEHEPEEKPDNGSIINLHTHYDIQQVEFVDASNTSTSCSATPSHGEPKIHYKNSFVNSEQSHIILHDEDELFGQSISAELRRIPSGKKKMKIKAEIYKILYENESDN